MKFKDRLDIYEKLTRLDRPIGILLLLWPTLWGLWLSSNGSPNPFVTVIFVLGVVLMRSAGCVMNDFADRNFDGHVERTRDRPLPAGKISSREALALAAGLAGLAFGLVLQLNALTVRLSVIALLLAIIYPFLKRFFWLPQAWLGIAFGFGVPMAFAAHREVVVPISRNKPTITVKAPVPEHMHALMKLCGWKEAEHPSTVLEARPPRAEAESAGT